MGGKGAGAEIAGGLEDDGLYMPTVKEHSLRKGRLHNYYLSLFSTAMKNRWPQRAYLGLYSGAGRARVAESGEIVATTALSAVQVRFMLDKFDRAMTRIRYRPQRPDDAHPIRLLEKKNVLLYYLVLCSKHELGRKFWKEARSGVDEQLDLLK